MERNRRSAAVVRYLASILGVGVALALLSFVIAGFAVSRMASPLAWLGAAALLYGLLMLSGYGPRSTGIAAIHAMRGKAGGNPLANYASSQEYKLLGRRAGDSNPEKHAEPGAELPDQAQRVAPDADSEHDLHVSLAVAGLLVIGLSWLFGQWFSR